ncbi:protein Flattop isoform X2 [Dendropsophus ebraccatus]|uniref:protein Flattop isoform X2 n=1 Tax=Dendropsophus ebraccatus TaxID=150705 RepID=UPI0038318BCE
MATYYSANQRPSTHDGFTQFISNDRGHLLPGVPRSKTSPWGTFIGTWDMPSKIPPAKVNLTSRSADASRRLNDWIKKSESLVSACNGLQPDVTGKVPHKIEEDPKQLSWGPSQRSERPPCSPPGTGNGGRSSRKEEQGDNGSRTSPREDLEVDS